MRSRQNWITNRHNWMCRVKTAPYLSSSLKITNGYTRKDRVGPCSLLTSKNLKFLVTWITYSSFHLFWLSSLLLLPLFLCTALHILSRKLITSTSSKKQHFHNGICTQVSEIPRQLKTSAEQVSFRNLMWSSVDWNVFVSTVNSLRRIPLGLALSVRLIKKVTRARDQL